jgi:multisubunit Na+/H+ antiporter MnhB subunit
MLQYLNLYMLQFVIALILLEVMILIIVKILQDNDLEDEMVSFDRQFSAILVFISFMKATESPRKKNLYKLILILILLLFIYAMFVGIKGGFDLFDTTSS